MNSNPAPTASQLAWRFPALGDVPVGLSWLFGLSGTFLAIGIAGLFAADLPPISLKTGHEEPKVEELPLLDAPMAELTTLEAPTEPVAEETPLEMPTEFTELPEITPLDLDLPEIAEALTEKDIFAIPTAPKVEDALRPIDPEVKPRPRPTPTPSKSTANRSTAPSTSGTPGGSSGGTRRITQSAPPYPAFAKSAGMQGSVSVAITFAPSGYVSSVSVTGTSGYSALDQSTTDHVRRTFRATPSATSSTYSKRFTFRLR